MCKREYSLIIVEFIEYLKNNKFTNYVSCDCVKNTSDTTITFQILFKYEEDDSYSIEVWKYENGKSKKDNNWINLDTERIDFKDTNSIKKVVGILEENMENIYYDDIPYVELILPIDILYDSEVYEEWRGLFASSYCLFRTDLRFTEYDHKLKNKWDKLKIDENSNFLLNESSDKLMIYKYLKDKIYKKGLNAQSLSVVLEEKIDNFDLLFEDIKKHRIPIVLSSISGSKTISQTIGDEYIKKITIKDCKKEVCKHIMDKGSDEESGILFIIDNPETIPETNKNPEQYQYG
jgi:hypothetical protein